MGFTVPPMIAQRALVSVTDSIKDVTVIRVIDGAERDAEVAEVVTRLGETVDAKDLMVVLG